ncbi:MAG: GntR family transcriptional regulator [Pseudomonadota bacterium]
MDNAEQPVKRRRGRPRKWVPVIPVTDKPSSVPAPFGTSKRDANGNEVIPLVKQVYDELLKGLDEGRYRPGERIKATDLATALNLSRAPVREALHVLAGQGMVEMRPDKGAVMRELSIHDLIEIYEVVVGPACVGVIGAAQNIDLEDNRARVEAARDDVLALLDIPPSVVMYDRLIAFHHVINDIAQKPHATHLFRALNLDYWHRFLVAIIDLEQYMPRYVDNYRRLADAILAGDVLSAEAIMKSHGQWSCERLREGWDRQFGSLFSAPT